MSGELTEEEKGKARVMAIMCGGVIPAWAMPGEKRSEDMYKDKAIEMIKNHKIGKLSEHGRAVSGAVMAALAEFCEQEDEFAQSIVQSDKTFDECIEHTVKGVTWSISDREVYNRAANFYFPGAEVHMTPVIDLIGDAATPPTPKNENDTPPTQKNKLDFSFDDLF